ncbi:MAG: hypothetical protein II922_12480 [Succinimonas sp.]|nr:hypothetical protein [Succinimonas sp.]
MNFDSAQSGQNAPAQGFKPVFGIPWFYKHPQRFYLMRRMRILGRMQLLTLNSRNPPEYLPDKMAPALSSRIPKCSYILSAAE